MEPKENRIRHPYQAPEGYFSNLAAKVQSRRDSMPAAQPELKVVHTPKQENRETRWIAWAAAVAVLAVAGIYLWFHYRPVEPGIVKQAPLPAKPVVVADTLIIAPEVAENNAIAVAEKYLDEQETITPSPAALSAEDMAIAMELEDDGLIVLDMEDALFDEMDIEP
ncbi:MAG: hypothetical protein JNL57_03190 [Bacteroidetes bacterium]|nr:hypothetical protein [Bacteroidota bacterium]